MTLILHKPNLTKETRSIDFRRAASLGQTPGSHRLWGMLFFLGVLTGNVLLKMNNSGLRSTAIPLVGLSYSF